MAITRSLVHVHIGLVPWPAMPASDDPHADSPILQSVQGDGYLIQRAQEALLQGNPRVSGSNECPDTSVFVSQLGKGGSWEFKRHRGTQLGVGKVGALTPRIAWELGGSWEPKN